MIREEAIKILDDVIPPPNHVTVDLDHLPIAQAWVVIKNELKRKRKKGKWKDHGIVTFTMPHQVKECSVCHCTIIGGGNFCSECGADMRGDADET